ncbi:MAG: SPFH domain-containing protein [Acidimicrobiales bacterium]|nr:SPFH domain-containing protein [Acidimicrobiales bacterium]
MTIPFTPFDDDDDQRPSKGREPDPVEPLGGPGASPDRPSALDDDDDDEPVLGTAPTLSKAEAAGRRPTGAGSSSDGTPPRDRRAKRRSRPVMGLAVVVLLAAALAGVPLLRSAFQRTPKDRVGISYGGGPVEGVHFQKIVAPGSGLFFNGFFDSLYLYPADQLNYILADTPGTKGQEATTDAVVAPTSDRVTVSYQVAVYYKLNTDQLRAFHEQLGLRYQAYTDDGWDALIADTLRQQIEAALQEETRRHTVADLYGDADLLVQIQQEIQATISARLEAALGRRFFCGPTFAPGGECGDPTFIIKRIDIPESVAAAFESNRTSEVLITTRENEVRQREQEARAIAVINEALQQNSRAYVLLKAIESGKINFWVIPEGNDVDLTAPESATPPTAGE